MVFFMAKVTFVGLMIFFIARVILDLAQILIILFLVFFDSDNIAANDKSIKKWVSLTFAV